MKFIEVLRAKLKTLIDERAAAIAAMDAATATATAENRSDLNDTETVAFDTARSRIAALDGTVAYRRLGDLLCLEDADGRVVLVARTAAAG